MLAAEVGDEELDAALAHGEGVLDDGRVEGAVADACDEGRGGIEADDLELAELVGALRGVQRADGPRLVGREDPVEIGVRRQDGGDDLIGLGRVAHGVF